MQGRRGPRALTRVAAAIAAAVLSLLSYTIASPASAADSNVTAVGDLQANALGCTPGDTITIDADIVAVNEVVQVGCADLTIDLNGHATALRQIYVPPGDQLTIEDAAGGGSLAVAATTTLVPGIRVPSGAFLVVNSGTVTVSGGDRAAAIGGSQYEDAGSITIHGGTVTATCLPSRGAAIGGGEQGDGGTFYMDGGTVIATASLRGAGIGGGNGGSAGTITIDGGTVIASAGQNGAGIGGYTLGGVGIITVNGGTVTATGGQHSAGIGGSG